MPASRPRRSGGRVAGPRAAAGRPVTTSSDRGHHDLQAVQRHTVRVLVTSQAVGALGMTIGFATASLLARDISGSDTQAGLVQTCQVLGRGRGVVRPGPLDVAPWTSGRTRHGLPRRRHGERARRGGRGDGVDGTAPDRRIAAGRDVGGQPQQPVRRDRPRPGKLSGPRPLDRGLGLDDRSRRRPQPHRFGCLDRPAAVAARADRSVRRRRRRHPRRCARAVRRTPSGSAAGRPTGGRRPRRRAFLVAPGLRADPGAAGPRRGHRRAGRSPRGDDHGDGDDAAPHGARRRRAGDHRRGDQRARAGDVRVRPCGRVPGRPGRPSAHGDGGRDSAAGRPDPRRVRARGNVVAGLRGTLPARPGLVLRHRRRARPC